jgi:CDP-6-deoxy-D-xylo-4-hexulose-3-dehydrase
LLKKETNAMMNFMNSKEQILYGGVLLGVSERKAIDRVLDRNWWGLAEEGEQFEKELAQAQGVKHAIFVNSGSSALELGIVALQLPKGSEVIVPACTFPTPIATMIRCGIVPVVCDVDEHNFISPESIEESISSKTKAILLVYVGGNVGRLDAVLSIAKKHNLQVIEDNCDGFGGTYKKKMLGSFGTVSVISTHAAHIISTGQGGVVFTDSDDIAQKVRTLRDWGRDAGFNGGEIIDKDMPAEYMRYTYTSLGYNFQPLELQAAMGRVQLRRLQHFKKRRQDNWNVLYSELKDVVEVQQPSRTAFPCWHTFPMLLKDNNRPSVVRGLTDAQIDWRPILAGNIARQPAFRRLVISRDTLSRADKIFERGFWVSVHPMHGSAQMKRIAQVIKEGLGV